MSMTQSNATENSAAYDIFEQLQAEILKPEQERNEMLTTLCKKMHDEADKLAEKHEKTQLALDRASESVRALEDSRKRRFEMYESHLAHKARAFHREVVDLVDEAELHRRKQISNLFPTKFTPDVVHDTVFIFKDIDKVMQVVKTVCPFSLFDVQCNLCCIDIVLAYRKRRVRVSSEGTLWTPHPDNSRSIRILLRRQDIWQRAIRTNSRNRAIRGDLAIYPLDKDHRSAHAIRYTYYGRYISSPFEGDEYMHLSEWHATDPETRYICAQAIAHEGLQPDQVPARIGVLSIMRDLDSGDRRTPTHQLHCVEYNPLLRCRLHTTAHSLQTKVVGEQSKTKKRLRTSS